MILRNSINAIVMAAGILMAPLTGMVASAADLPYRKAPALAYVAPPVFSWTGFYAGLNVGGGFAAANAFNSYLGQSNAGSISGIVGGGQAGYNYQVTSMFVVGIENDIAFTSLKSNNSLRGVQSSLKLPFFGTGRARAGLALLDQRLFVYGTAGLAGGQVNDTGLKKLRLGWTAGGGAEYAISDNWSAKAEYLYTDLGKDFTNQGLAPRHDKFHLVRAGLNYHFNLF